MVVLRDARRAGTLSLLLPAIQLHLGYAHSTMHGSPGQFALCRPVARQALVYIMRESKRKKGELPGSRGVNYPPKPWAALPQQIMAQKQQLKQLPQQLQQQQQPQQQPERRVQQQQQKQQQRPKQLLWLLVQGRNGNAVNSSSSPSSSSNAAYARCNQEGCGAAAGSMGAVTSPVPACPARQV